MENTLENLLKEYVKNQGDFNRVFMIISQSLNN